MKKSTRIILAIISLSMLSSLFLPLWQIQLWAPQYPEGLNMKIWHNHLSGAFDIINGLNHYIGMKLIKEEMFPELAYIGMLIGMYVALGLLAALSGKKLLLKIFVATGLVYGIVALYDFYQWGYDYGHNLDPKAAIQVPGMSYQPPVVGYKNLLNFTAYSGPDTGGWVIIGASAIAILLLVIEWKGERKTKINPTKPVLAVAGLFLLLGFMSCSAEGPAPIRYGSDLCDHCRMTLSDVKYGAEMITRTNKVYKFDDINCMVNYLKANKEVAMKTNKLYVVDFKHEGQFADALNGFYFTSSSLNTPMGGQVAAFSNAADRDTMMASFSDAKMITWKEIQNLY